MPRHAGAAPLLLSSAILAFSTLPRGAVALTMALRGGGPAQFGASVLSARVASPPPSASFDLQMLSFYHFTEVEDPIATRDKIWEALARAPAADFASGETGRAGYARPELPADALRGTVYVAGEGINAQLAVPTGLLEETRARLEEVPELGGRGALDLNIGAVVPAETATFKRLIVRSRRQILTDKLDERGLALDLEDGVEELSPEDWHAALTAEESAAPPLVLDCRNRYESDVGSFRHAVPLGTDAFSETWEALEEKLPEDLDPERPVHIFCTGGIRCVKVGAYLKQHKGLKNVKSLNKGIIAYERWAEDNGVPSAWEGDNFLFDKRSEGIAAEGETSADADASADAERR